MRMRDDELLDLYLDAIARVTELGAVLNLKHATTRDCWCLPRVEVYERADLVIHNSKEDAN